MAGWALAASRPIRCDRLFRSPRPRPCRRPLYRRRIDGISKWARAHAGQQMNALLREYLPILIFFGIAIGLSMAMVIASLIVGRQRPDPEKLSAYECGFDAFDDARRKFDVRYYLVAILFIIFDLEVAFLFPWAVTLGEIGMFGFWSMVAFLGVLTVGFIYEWKKGALEWE
jgi:NADH-quinone oxidoreductase subunit A